MDPKYSAYLEFYCINQLSKFIDKLRKERNEYLFNSSYLYNESHKGNTIFSFSCKLIIIIFTNYIIFKKAKS